VLVERANFPNDRRRNSKIACWKESVLPIYKTPNLGFSETWFQWRILYLWLLTNTACWRFEARASSSLSELVVCTLCLVCMLCTCDLTCINR
jgi:hypothetical protein